MPKDLTQEQIHFIENNKNTMRQKDIAAAIKVTPACVNKRIKGNKPKEEIPAEFFDWENWKKEYTY